MSIKRDVLALLSRDELVALVDRFELSPSDRPAGRPEIQRVATNLGESLNKARFALEGANSALEGLLAGIDFNDERKLGDARNRDVVVGYLVQHLSKLPPRKAHLSEPDLLGRACECAIEKFADDAGRKGGELESPRKVVELLQPEEGMRVCDPTCGSGGMFIECAHHLQRHQMRDEDAA